MNRVIVIEPSSAISSLLLFIAIAVITISAHLRVAVRGQAAIASACCFSRRCKAEDHASCLAHAAPWTSRGSPLEAKLRCAGASFLAAK
jgi:hypothetical protein